MYVDLELPGFKNARRYSLVTSTMDLASELIESNSDLNPDWSAIIVADQQSSGRGRQGRSWLGSAGAFMATAIFVTDAPLSRLSGYSLSVGVAISKVLEESYGIATALKWPNDIVISFGKQGLRKLGGILIEVQEHHGYRCILVGLGLNVTKPPDDVREIAVCLHELGGADLLATNLIAPLAGALKEAHQGFVAQGGFRSVVLDWSKRSCFIQGRSRITIDLGAEREIVGTFSGVDDTGALVLDVGGRREIVISGHITSFILGEG